MKAPLSRAGTVLLMLAVGNMAGSSSTADAGDPVAHTTLPFPTGRYHRLGALHSLPALQCLVSATSNGHFTASLGDKRIPRGKHTCAAPVVDVGEVRDVLDAEANGKPRQWENLAWRVRLLATAYNSFSERFGEESRYSRLKWGRHLTTGDMSLVLGKPSTGLHAYGEHVARLLTLHRNSDLGAVWRYSGKYEVLALTSVRRGVCLSNACQDVAAVDTTGSGACASSGCREPLTNRYDLSGRLTTEDAVAVVTHAEPGERPKPVSVLQTGFLGLGRAVSVRKGWLKTADAWNLTASIQTQLYTQGERFEELKNEPSLRSLWPLSGTAAADAATEAQGGNSSTWLQKIAIVLCHEPVPVYVDRRLCVGIKPRTRPPVDVAYNENDVEVDDPTVPVHQTGAIWRVVPARQEQVAAHSCAPGFKTTPSTQPSWTAGTASREINAASPDEVALARRLSRCTTKLDATSPVGALRGLEDLSRLADVKRLRDTLHAGAFMDADLPPEPSSASEFAEALVIVALAALGVVGAAPNFSTGSSRWERVRYYFIVVAGGSSFTPLVMLTVREHRGANWHAATTREAIHVAFSPTTGACRGLPTWCNHESVGLRGSSLLLSETLVVVSTNHYRWERLAVALALTAVAYAAVSGFPDCWYTVRHKAVGASPGGAALTPGDAATDDSDGGALVLQMPATVSAPPSRPGGG